MTNDKTILLKLMSIYCHDIYVHSNDGSFTVAKDDTSCGAISNTRRRAAMAASRLTLFFTMIVVFKRIH